MHADEAGEDDPTVRELASELLADAPQIESSHIRTALTEYRSDTAAPIREDYARLGSETSEHFNDRIEGHGISVPTVALAGAVERQSRTVMKAWASSPESCLGKGVSLRDWAFVDLNRMTAVTFGDEVTAAAYRPMADGPRAPSERRPRYTREFLLNLTS